MSLQQTFWSAMVSEAQREAYRPPKSQDRCLVHAIQVPQGSRNIDVNEPREPVSVVVDYRERNSGVLDALATMPGVDVRVEHLPVGDYLVGGVFVFERKTLVDLVASIMDARLFKQACRLACDARRSAFILEGTLTQLAQSHMRREAIRGALVTITLMLGLPVLRSRDPYESARLMVYAARQAQAWSTGAIARRVRRPKGKRRAQLQMLQGLPGIGPCHRRSDSVADWPV